MARPQSKRIVYEPPLFTDFKPVGVSVSNLRQVELALDEFEAFRLVDYNGLSHAEAADEMEISRSTFSRLIEKTRRKIADFLIHGTSLNISGGNIHFRRNIISCHNCGHKFNTNFKTLSNECPICHSRNIINLAGGFGHGKCCAIENNKK